jgi:hypothetical protein
MTALKSIPTMITQKMIKRRKMRRRRIWMRMMAKTFGRLAIERWYIHPLTILIPW